jgi:capsule biosynthesis phosphatase
MKYIILCGGIGKQTATLPKPLNFIQGRHMIEYVIDVIPSNEVFIIYNIFLDEYNFQEILINKCKSKKFHFSQIDYLTRGAVETAFVGINKFLGECGGDNITFGDNISYTDNITFGDNIVFIDSDNPPNIDKPIPIFNNEFIGYNQTTHNKCYGLCGFKNVNNFLKYVKMLLDAASECDAEAEFNFSTLYNLITNNGIKVEHYHIDNLDITNNKLRICFDLDNTLVSYPTITGDYSTVKPIAHNLSLLKRLKNDGHEIIIYTARRMKTHGGNVGKVIKDIAGITIDTLERLNIEYDELIFGKPIADIYIDDRAINPYINDVSFFGLSYDGSGGSGGDASQFIPNKIKNNKYNHIRRCGEHIVKTGPLNILRGELYYYQNIPSGFENYFPKLIDYKNYEDTIELKIEYIEGIPLYYLYKNRLLTHRHIDELFDILDRLHKHNPASSHNSPSSHNLPTVHNSPSSHNPIIITSDNVKNNYIKKLENRFNIHDYYFEDARDVLKDITDGIETHFNPVISPVIHGDFWFSNIILSYEGCGSGGCGVSGGSGYRLIDMKGTIDNILTLNGDIYYDYGKLYQSILGYDLVLNDCDSTKQTKEYIQSMKAYFLQKCIAKRLDITYLKCVVKGLVFGTMPFISHYSKDIKNNIWELIKGDLLNSGHI